MAFVPRSYFSHGGGGGVGWKGGCYCLGSGNYQCLLNLGSHSVTASNWAAWVAGCEEDAIWVAHGYPWRRNERTGSCRWEWNKAKRSQACQVQVQTRINNSCIFFTKAKLVLTAAGPLFHLKTLSAKCSSSVDPALESWVERRTTVPHAVGSQLQALLLLHRLS